MKVRTTAGKCEHLLSRVQPNNCFEGVSAVFCSDCIETARAKCAARGVRDAASGRIQATWILPHIANQDDLQTGGCGPFGNSPFGKMTTREPKVANKTCRPVVSVCRDCCPGTPTVRQGWVQCHELPSSGSRPIDLSRFYDITLNAQMAQPRMPEHRRLKAPSQYPCPVISSSCQLGPS